VDKTEVEDLDLVAKTEEGEDLAVEVVVVVEAGEAVEAVVANYILHNYYKKINETL